MPYVFIRQKIEGYTKWKGYKIKHPVICTSWSPVGLAFKLPEKEVASLISSGKAKPLKYFPKGHVKYDFW